MTKKTMKFICPLLLVFLVALFWPKAGSDGAEELNRVMHSYVKWARKELGASVSFSGVSAFGGPIQIIHLGIHIDVTPSLEEARRLYIRGTQELLARINSDEKLRPFLADFPFTYKNLGYMISFRELAPDDELTHGRVTSVQIVREMVIYDEDEKRHVPGTIRELPKEKLREQYEEALRIVQENNNYNNFLKNQKEGPLPLDISCDSKIEMM